MHGNMACRARWKAGSYGGRQALHPSSPVSRSFMDSVGGSSFEAIRARAIKLPALPAHLNQIRVRRDLRGQLDESAYAITAGQVIGRRRQPLRADEVREITGLDEERILALLLFGRDEYLEHLWNHRERFVGELALAGYDLIVAPSFSAWEPRPRLEHLYAFKRSLIIFEMLLEYGAPAVARVGFANETDAIRTAAWVRQNPAVEQVAVDLGTYRGEVAFHRQLELLTEFDCDCGRRVSLLFNGPSTFARATELFARFGVDRVQITNSRAIARAGAAGTTYREKAATETETVLAARRAVAKAHDGARLPPRFEAEETRAAVHGPARRNRWPQANRPSRSVELA